VTVHLVVVVLGSMGLGRVEARGRTPQGRAWNAVIRRAFPVMRAYGELLGPKQTWEMFGVIATHTHQLRIEVVTPAGTRPVFVERSDEADWNRLAFDQYRWRETLGLLGASTDPEGRRAAFVSWVGPRVAAAVPDACEVDVQVWRARLLAPEALRAGERLAFDQQVWSSWWRVPGRTCP
jgi:hypothetical protein